MQRVEAKAQDMEAPAQYLQFFSMETTYAVIFAHKGKSNTSFRTVKGLVYVCALTISTKCRAFILNRSISQK